MNVPRLFFCCLLLGGVLCITACARLFSTEASLPSWHSQDLPEGRADCTECHKDQLAGALKPSEAFSHSTVFIRNHRFYAEQDDRLCATCHARSFCNDCHANEVEMKPSLKYGNRPDREFMHRGDYLTRHMIDGKTDPASCYRCHGRSNNEQCVACHR